ncbi:BglG family transcription antiterminator [Vallitalea okinawensis]|uniref:BglG family transcription antiterminator n=1 Tax=Vallitalea okinawensis TaxID=2078660 RepID=UPI000CFCC8E0|nr:BglG family transcription antiterminator [Vallitalea okinawensis]
MYCLNKRQTEIITDLLNKNEYISAKAIAEQHQVSIRTIRYDLEIIEYWLNENKAIVVKVPKKGIKIKAATDSVLLLEKLKFLSVENRVLTEKERVNFVIIELLSSEKNMSIEDICNHLLLSRNTILKVIKKVELYLESNNLKLNKIYGKGLAIRGEEIHKRIVLVEVFLDIFDIHNIILAMNDDEAYQELIEFCKSKYKSFHFENMKIIFNEIMNIEKEYKFYLTDTAIARLLVYMTITVNRLSKCHYIDKELVIIDKLENEISFLIAKRLQKLFSIDVIPEEENEIAIRLMEARSYQANHLIKYDTNTQLEEDVTRITRHVIHYAENELNVEFNHDKKLYNGLGLHLKTSLIRIKNNKQIKNDYTNEITSRYPLVFQIVKESLQSFENMYTFEDAEIAYITLHIRAAYERNYKENYKLTALVVCIEGLALLNLLTTKLKMNFPDLGIIETCSIHDYEQYKNEIDLIITTDKFKIKDVEVRRVTPFIDNKDIFKINQTLIKLNKFKQIYKYNQSKYTEGGRVILLDELLNIDMIELGVDAMDWEDAIRKASIPLLQNEKVELEYVDNMVQAIRDLGPYIVIMPGIAFAHARPDGTVKETCMSMITLKEPINFGSDMNDPVSIIFAFGAENGNDHLKALQDLAKFLAIEENVEFLKGAKDKKVILDKILN